MIEDTGRRSEIQSQATCLVLGQVHLGKISSGIAAMPRAVNSSVFEVIQSYMRLRMT